ncbi:MAG: DNA mismatch repair endonuclease MutL [Thermoflexales bacterium]|nr:DNA mismatch repair endonuclease MutL [Thermoflexales bacterium]
MPIHVLPSNLVSQIAAGEVVERPASVVKELIENAIDAGATDIIVEARDGGRSFLRISDNGSGIPAAEVELAFSRHATSKLSTADDLSHIRTLGFRGEALASIASVAKVTCVTRARGETTGTRLVIEADGVMDRSGVGAPAGTVITVENLFYTVPARLKFLKADTTERRQIDTLISRYALAYPGIRFNLINNGRTSFQTTGNGSLKDVLIAVYGVEVAEQTIPLPSPDDGSVSSGEGLGVRVSGFISAPALSRSTRSDMTIFVNGRWVQDRGLNTAVLQAYHTLLMVGRYPLCILRVELDPEDVDVNVHPAKTEVRFRNNDMIFRVVQRTVRRTLVEHAPIPQMQSAPPIDAWQPSLDTHDDVAAARLAQLRALQPVERSFSQAVNPSTGELVDQSIGQLVNRSISQPVDQSPVTNYQSPIDQLPVTNPQLPPLRVIGQIGAMYIITEGPEGMYLIDQHAAHERILYEKFMADKTSQHLAVQNLLDPIALEFSPDESTLIEEHLDVLNAIGLHVEPFGGSTWLVRSLPALLMKDDLRMAMRELVADLMAGDLPFAANEETKLITRVCKRAAIKGGQVLSVAEMNELIRQLELCAAPRTCPHGRPTMIHFSASQMAREFGRI